MMTEARKKYMKEYNQRPEVKKCKEEYAKLPEHRKHHDEHHKEYNKRVEVKEHAREYHKRPEVKVWNKDYHKRPEVKEHYLRTRYNITTIEFNTFLEKNNYRCPICKREIKDIKKCVDHNHKTGKVRGVLCDNCNKGLGCFKDDILIINSAIEYLKGVGG